MGAIIPSTNRVGSNVVHSNKRKKIHPIAFLISLRHCRRFVYFSRQFFDRLCALRHLGLIARPRRHDDEADLAGEGAGDDDGEEQQVDGAFDDADGALEALRRNHPAVT